jgi:hypothetical protein
MARAVPTVLALLLVMIAGCAADIERPAIAPIPPATSTDKPPGRAAASGPGRSAPTLGLAWPVTSRGYGEVQPAVIDNGGDPTGLVTKITWESWGGPIAIGHGTTTWVPPQAAVGQGRQERATVVAYRLGVCGGHPAYQAVQHYFPGHGETFDASAETFNACTGP